MSSLLFLIKILNKKDGLICDKCNRVYKNNNSLRTHRCKSIDKIEQLENKIDKLSNIILEMAKNPQVITNNIDNSTKNITNNTMNITLNCLMDTTGKPIEYLLNQEDIFSFTHNSIVEHIGWEEQYSNFINKNK